MKPTPALVRGLVGRLVAPGEQSAVLSLLARYGSEAHEREVPRVQVGILKLSGGRLERVRELVTLAKTDYRDVLAAAEYPGEMGTSVRQPPSAAELEMIRRDDRDQYLAWLGAYAE